MDWSTGLVNRWSQDQILSQIYLLLAIVNTLQLLFADDTTIIIIHPELVYLQNIMNDVFANLTNGLKLTNWL
jgi:hypothetical protein